MNKKLLALSCVLFNGAIFANPLTEELALPKRVATEFHATNSSTDNKNIIGGKISRQEESDCRQGSLSC